MTLEEARAFMKEYTRNLVIKWNKTGLLDEIKDDISKSSMAVILESEPKQLIASEMTEEELKFSNSMRILYDAGELFVSQKKNETIL